MYAVSFLVMPMVIAGLLTALFLLIVIFYRQSDKQKVVRATYLYFTTVTALLVCLFGVFRLGQAVLNATILPTERGYESVHRPYAKMPDMKVVDQVSYDAAMQKVEKISQERAQIQQKVKHRNTVNTSLALFVVGLTLFIYNRKYLTKL